METISLWAYEVKISDAIAFGAFLVAATALLLSWLAFRLNRNSLSLYEGCDQRGTVLYITNNSPHAVTISNFGNVAPDGHSSSLLGEDSYRSRIAPRDEDCIIIGTEQEFRIKRAKGSYSRHGLFVTLATGHKFYNVNRVKIWCWWILGWLDGSRNRRNQKLQ